MLALARRLTGLSVAVAMVLPVPAAASRIVAPEINSRAIPILQIDGLRFRDLDRNGRLTPYEDWRLAPATRAADLLSRMNLAEKAGQLVIAQMFNNAPFGQTATGYALPPVEQAMGQAYVTHFNSMLVADAATLARANNELQERAERGRLGIPVLVTTDPRHGIGELTGASLGAGQFSTWPNPIGMGALGDPVLIRKQADIMRRDLRATGFGLLLGPQIDLATEPRWPRINGTYGEDVERSGALAAAFVDGLQGGRTGIGRTSVAAVLKHFVGYGAAADGFDAHNRYGRFARLDEREFAQHLKPFQRALPARPSGVMPAYSILSGLTLDGAPVEQVGVGFNRQLVTGVLRDRLGFEGVVISDWAITNDCGKICRDGFHAGERPTFQGISMAWGVEDLTESQRFAKGLNAGIDQFGGVQSPAPIVAAANAGLVREEVIDRAVMRVLERNFALGLFEAPFVDPDRATRIVGDPVAHALGERAQAEAMVLLKGRGKLHLPAGTKVWLLNVDGAAARAAGLVPVDRPEDADVALARLRSPHEMLHLNFFFGAMQQEGTLAFDEHDHDLAQLQALPALLPLFVGITLDRPAILTPLTGGATALLADFGASDRAFLSVIRGLRAPRGRLPFELPSSMQAVVQQRPGTAADSANPLFPLGYRGG